MINKRGASRAKFKVPCISYPMKSNIIILLNFKFSLIIIDFCDLNEAEMV